MFRLSRRASLQLVLGGLRAALPSVAFAQSWPTLVSHWTFDETSDAADVFADSGPAQVPMAIVGTWADLSTPSLVQGFSGTSAYTDGSGYGRVSANIAAHDLSELTISFYYRRNSAARHILLAVGGGAQVGDLVIEVRENGKLRGYHVGQDGVRRFFESRSGITASNLQVGPAHRIDLTLGSSGACIYLDGLPLTDAFIPANRNGWNNTRVKRIGVRADGAFDHLRIWDGQLTAQQVASLEPPQSIPPQNTVAVAVNIGTLAAFTRSTIDVTTVEGWPAGKLPKRVLQQGTHASAYIRRSWKPSFNTGTHIDFLSGWQKTAGPERIRLQLDDGSEIDLNYRVGHTIPSPTGGGVTRTLDPSGGGNFTTWASAIAALTSGDVLIVRAPTGTWTDSGGHAIPNYVYDVNSNPAPAAGVSNVTIVAHPDDVAAGRRPIIWRNAGRYARFKYAASAAWQVHADLGGGQVIYESIATSPRPGHSYFGAYRDQVGDWIAMYPCQAITDASNRSSILHDTTYASPVNGTDHVTYLGPSILYNTSNSRWECRLNPPVKQTYMNPASSLPYPPWDWTKHYPPSTDARRVEIVLTDGAGWPGTHLLNIEARNGWKFYNLDFVYGDCAVNAQNCSTQPQFFGCCFLGGSPTEFNNNGSNINTTSSAVLTFRMDYIPATDLTFDRCTLHGSLMPWTDFTEGKGFEGSPGLGARRDFTSWTHAKALFRYCDIRNWWQFTWLGDWKNKRTPIKWHFHHSTLRGFGMDAGLIMSPGSVDLNVNRCFLKSAQMYGFSETGGSGINRNFNFNVDLRLTTIMAGGPFKDKWVYRHDPNCPAYVHAQSTGHGGRSEHSDRRYYNTFVGTQNTNGVEFTDSTDGCGCGIGPDSRGTNHRVFNNIGAVYPGFSWPLGKSALVGVYSRKSANSQYDHNILFKAPGLNSPSAGKNTFLVVNSGSSWGTPYADLLAMRSAEGFETNGSQVDPQFVVPPGWVSSNPYAGAGAFDLGNYMLGPSSPAKTGARNLNDQNFPDYDFETSYTWVGGVHAPYRGALDPNVPLVEQEVGIVGPQPPSIA